MRRTKLLCLPEPVIGSNMTNYIKKIRLLSLAKEIH